jgi:CheY-like chemotaxis protein
MPGKTGLILNKTRTEALAAAQNKSDAMFFDIRLPQTAGFELRPQ